MAKITQFDDELHKFRLAREEFLAAFCWWWPSVYKASCPLADDIKTLNAWKTQIENQMMVDAEAIQRESGNPFDNNPRLQTSFIDFSTVDDTTRLALAIRLPGEFGLPPTKSGFGVDPADGVRKLYCEFDEVESAYERIGLSEFFALRKKDRELYGKFEASTNDDERADLKSQRGTIGNRLDEIRRDFQLRTGGKKKLKVQKLHTLQDEFSSISEQVFDASGDFKVSPSDPVYARYSQIRDQIDDLRKELGL